MVKVVHVLSGEWREASESSRLYVGREMSRYSLPRSRWANPYKVDDKSGNRREIVLRLYEQRLRMMMLEDPTLIDKLRSDMAGVSVVGCWCKARRPGEPDHDCHGDILVALAGLTNAEYQTWLTGAKFLAP